MYEAAGGEIYQSGNQIIERTVDNRSNKFRKRIGRNRETGNGYF